MSLILSITVASALGSFLGQFLSLWSIGLMAVREQKKQQRDLMNARNKFLQIQEKENQRLRRYAQLES